MRRDFYDTNNYFAATKSRGKLHSQPITGHRAHSIRATRLRLSFCIKKKIALWLWFFRPRSGTRPWTSRERNFYENQNLLCLFGHKLFTQLGISLCFTKGMSLHIFGDTTP